ncbi:hypothetical protein Q4I30_000879 [Leishmania utingensis]|uniref:Uncharacterized protein n=1 Tax=Leishmania utingensis TaxID=653362 RepID=A0AAW3AWU2_9TRYP
MGSSGVERGPTSPPHALTEPPCVRKTFIRTRGIHTSAPNTALFGDLGSHYATSHLQRRMGFLGTTTMPSFGETPRGLSSGAGPAAPAWAPLQKPEEGVDWERYVISRAETLPIAWVTQALAAAAGRADPAPCRTRPPTPAAMNRSDLPGLWLPSRVSTRGASALEGIRGLPGFLAPSGAQVPEIKR